MSSSCEVNLPNGGAVEGNLLNILSVSNENAVKIYEFLGVPYAEPPVGDLRFAKPKPVKPWTGKLKKAKEYGPAPWQPFFRNFGGNHEGEETWNPKEPMSEDCLQLNIWTPAISSSDEKLPVMVWIYGGGFATGSSTLDIYNGSQMAAQGCVIVSMNYRVGSLGFLYLGTEDAPGNQGLWDQNLALHWIQNNIAAFGGDSKNVTLFGESAGSVSVSAHLLSPHSIPLFSRAIMQSGCVLNHWGVLSPEEMKNRSNRLIEILSNNNDAPDSADSSIMKSLREPSAQTIVDSDWIVDGMFQWPWVPVIDGDFFLDSPNKLLKDGKFKHCPIILGNNFDEGSYFLVYNKPDLFPITDEPTDWNKETFEQAIKGNFEYYPHYPHKTSEKRLKAIVDEYWVPSANEKTPENNNELDKQGHRKIVSKAVGDNHLVSDTISWAEAYVSAGLQAYLYMFNKRSEKDPWPLWTGVKHADEIQFIFGQPLMEANTKNGEVKPSSEKEKRFSSEMMKLWTRFAKAGNPASLDEKVSWPAYDLDQRRYLEMADDGFTVLQDGFRLPQKHFWHTIFPSILD